MTVWTQSELSDHCPTFPHMVGCGAFIIVCPSRKEYLNPEVFGPAGSLNPVLRNEVYVALGLLLACSQAGVVRTMGFWRYPKKTGETPEEWMYRNKIGLWAGLPILITFHKDSGIESSQAWNALNASGLGYHYVDIVRHFKDISYEMLTRIDHSRRLYDRRPVPDNYRKLLGSIKNTTIENYEWVTPTHLKQLYHMATRMRNGFWEKFVAWFRRRKLAPETRRELGGRPGGLKEATEKKKRKAETDAKKRQQRKVRVRPEN